MTVVDARGYSCPQPVLMTKKGIETHGTPIKVLVDDKTPLQNILRFAANAEFKASYKEIDGEYEIAIE